MYHNPITYSEDIHCDKLKKARVTFSFIRLLVHPSFRLSIYLFIHPLVLVYDKKSPVPNEGASPRWNGSSRVYVF